MITITNGIRIYSDSPITSKNLDLRLKMILSGKEYPLVLGAQMTPTDPRPAIEATWNEIITAANELAGQVGVAVLLAGDVTNWANRNGLAVPEWVISG